MYPTIAGLDEAQTRKAVAAVREAVGPDGNIARWNVTKKLSSRIQALDEIISGGPTPSGGLRGLAQVFLRNALDDKANDEVLAAAATLLRVKYQNDIDQMKADEAAIRSEKRARAQL